MDTTAKLTRMPKARRFEAEWQTGPDTFTVLAVGHMRGALYASLRRERAGAECNGITSRTYAPFQDMARIDLLRIPRYNAKRAERYFDEQVERVLSVLEGALDEKSDVILTLFAIPTTA